MLRSTSELLTIAAALTLYLTSSAQDLTLSDDQHGWRAIIDSQTGSLRSVSFRRDGQWDLVQFRTNQFAGPRWAGVPTALKDTNSLAFEGRVGDVLHTLRYQTLDGHLALVAGLQNLGSNSFAPREARLILGVDTEMIRHPQWDSVLFPTLLRCEKTHFWGYLMGPTGRILGIASPDPVASYNLEYNQSGHRIFTCDLDLLHALPLPSRHPQNLTELKPGEQKTWTIFLDEPGSLDAVKPELAALARAPMIEADRFTLAAGEKSVITIWSTQGVKLAVAKESGASQNLSNSRSESAPSDLRTAGGLTGQNSSRSTPAAAASEIHLRPGKESGVWLADFTPSAGPGVYILTATTPEGKQSEARIYAREPWSWYLKRAREEALNKPQKASTHRESWVGCFSTRLAQRYFPEPSLDEPAEKMFREILGLMYDLEKARPLPASKPGRSQNHSVMISLLAASFATTGHTNDLDLAARLADWLIENRQADDGSYRANSKTGVHYTSVHYMAKNILELAAQEKKLAAGSELWRGRYQRHFDSARRAVDDLLNRGDRVETEGEQTLEDSMIANTASQLALFALLQSDPAEREKYALAARRMLDKHRCLSQQIIPDCRMRGATLRFWESQYDVLMKPNMVNSPHGWTARKTPGTWYLYLLTGEEQYLRETMDALGACMQLIDLGSGELRWGFVPDPYVQAEAFEPNPAQPGRGVRVQRIIGEQCVPMISGWWKAPPGQAVQGYSTTLPGSCCDNDVHEVFKAMEEIALTAAYVLERSNGEIAVWNCTARREGETLVIVPAEKVVSRVHLNLKAKHRLRIDFPGASSLTGEYSGMQWLGPGGIPELLACGTSAGSETSFKK
jgi:hypothetical protein